MTRASLVFLSLSLSLSLSLAAVGCHGNMDDPRAPDGTTGIPPGIVDGSGGRAGGGAIADGAAGASCGAAGAPGDRTMTPGSRGIATPSFSGVPTAAEPPDPISGGTLLVLRDGVTAVAADPDRDAIFVVDLSDVANPRLQGTIALLPHDQPGRLVEDGAGRVHVVLRNAGALATVDPATATIALRRSLCRMPRGIAYDGASDRLFVACAGGELMTLAPAADAPERTLRLDPDLRDVIVDGANLLVTRFRSAEVLVVDAAGAVATRIAPATFASQIVRSSAPFDASVAWRAVARPGGGAMMVHQRGMKGTIDHRPGGYGSGSCDTIVHTAVSVVGGSEPAVAGPAIPGFVLPVDVALSADGTRVAIVAAGNARNMFIGHRLFVANTDDVARPWEGGCAFDGKHAPVIRSCVPGATGGIGGAAGGPASVLTMCSDVPAGVEPTAVAFVGGGSHVIVQTREPAQLWVVPQTELSAGMLPAPYAITLSDRSRGDLGHAIFHSNSGGGLACASCHPEGHEDGRVWNLACDGPRRTQDIGGRVAGTEPFHWKGDLGDFGALVNEVFVNRMSGPMLTVDEASATRAWIDTVAARPALHDAADPAVARGRALFESTATGCAICHAGARLTNNATVDVGTAAGPYQVPSLREVAWRPPYMHDGCALDLASRFTSQALCNGGDKHGHTSQLAPSDLADLVAYLESL